MNAAKAAGFIGDTNARAHAGIMNVLTPEQRAKVHELHKGGHSDSTTHEVMRKLHGK